MKQPARRAADVDKGHSHFGAEEQRLARLMVELMQSNDAPPEAYARLDVDGKTGACLTVAQ